MNANNRYTYKCRFCDYTITSGLTDKDIAKTLLYQHIFEEHPSEWIRLLAKNPSLEKYIKKVDEGILTDKCSKCGTVFYAVNQKSMLELKEYHKQNCSS